MARQWEQSARGKALLILEQVFEEGAYSNMALKQGLSHSQLSQADKQLVTELVYGTVGRKLTLEWYLSHFIADRDRLDRWVYDLLMLSLYQLVYLDKLPDHAVVHEAVNLAKSKGRGADKFVNAILRQILASDLPDPRTIKRVNKRYSIQYSIPVWLVKRLIEDYGQERALRIFESLHHRNKASVRVVDPDRLGELLEVTGGQVSQLSPVGLTKDKGNFAKTAYFQQGLITIQDETSQLVAPTLNIEGHEHILDACAAPGGKTSHMAAYLKSGQVTALDLYDHKLALIKENADRLQVSDRVNTQKLDARKVHEVFAPDTFDKILVDAPCSGTGLIRRKPDIKYNKQTSDFDSLQNIQLEILASVCQTVKKGGIITYSTCSIVNQENRAVIEAFLAEHPNFEQVALTHEKENIVQEGCLLITPEQYLTDGFFIAQVRRKS